MSYVANRSLYVVTILENVNFFFICYVKKRKKKIYECICVFIDPIYYSMLNNKGLWTKLSDTYIGDAGDICEISRVACKFVQHHVYKKKTKGYGSHIYEF